MSAIAIEASFDVVGQLSDALNSSEFQVAAPVTAASPADALNAPIGPTEVQQVFQIITVVFTTASAGLTFAAKLRGILQRHPSEPVTLRDPTTGEVLGTVTAQTPEAEIASLSQT